MDWMMDWLINTFFFMFIFYVAFYLLCAYAIVKALRLMGYPNSWAGWIPLFQLYALADICHDENGNVVLFGQIIPAMLFNFWWLVSLAAGRIPYFGDLLALALQIICLGTCFIKIFSTVERRSEEEVRILGYVSGFIPLIGIIKILCYRRDF